MTCFWMKITKFICHFSGFCWLREDSAAQSPVITLPKFSMQRCFRPSVSMIQRLSLLFCTQMQFVHLIDTEFQTTHSVDTSELFWLNFLLDHDPYVFGTYKKSFSEIWQPSGRTWFKFLYLWINILICRKCLHAVYRPSSRARGSITDVPSLLCGLSVWASRRICHDWTVYLHVGSGRRHELPSH